MSRPTGADGGRQIGMFPTAKSLIRLRSTITFNQMVEGSIPSPLTSQISDLREFCE